VLSAKTTACCTGSFCFEVYVWNLEWFKLCIFEERRARWI
jgi:hypothetical protein